MLFISTAISRQQGNFLEIGNRGFTLPPTKHTHPPIEKTHPSFSTALPKCLSLTLLWETRDGAVF